MKTGFVRYIKHISNTSVRRAQFARPSSDRVAMEGGIDANKLREVAGYYPSGVTVVTARVGGIPVGFSCQAFHSLSLSPPMVVLMVGKNSTSWPRIRAAGRFCVNILAEDQSDLCEAFARSGADKFAGVSWSLGMGGSPLLADCAAWIECVLDSEYDGGDHMIATGRVIDADVFAGGTPLIFFRGSFHNIDDLQ
jgi:3-hydroxy-9,10-secoandrosta-1,3,5(10)-triene-9,17-dione monooxygenase reductase component